MRKVPSRVDEGGLQCRILHAAGRKPAAGGGAGRRFLHPVSRRADVYAWPVVSAVEVAPGAVQAG